MTTSEQYRTASSTLYDQAMVELEAGDLRQASEKLWGASAQALKSLAERRDWSHGSHGEFYRMIKRLRDEDGEEELAELFQSANTLHVNFYEDWLNESEVRKLAYEVQSFITRLRTL